MFFFKCSEIKENKDWRKWQLETLLLAGDIFAKFGLQDIPTLIILFIYSNRKKK